MIISQHIASNKNAFINLCSNHNVAYIYAFGSSITDNLDESKSDIDLIVQLNEPDPIKRGENLISLWDKFESFFHRKVDLLTESSIKNPFLKKSIDLTKVLIYDGKGKKILV